MNAMPIFEYQCLECGTRFEDLVLSQSKNPKKAACTHCGGKSVERVFSTFAARTESSNGDACFNKEAGICAAGGGRMPCGGIN
jgi:putative FmdB family regulatory protein